MKIQGFKVYYYALHWANVHSYTSKTNDSLKYHLYIPKYTLCVYHKIIMYIFEIRVEFKISLTLFEGFYKSILHICIKNLPGVCPPHGASLGKCPLSVQFDDEDM